jgi:uncharacterized protein (TIGR02246 family)
MTQSSQPHNDLAALQELIDRTNDAERRGDAEAFVAGFADDVVIMAPGEAPLEGREACREFVSGVLSWVVVAFDRELTYTTSELRVLGDWAFERGSYAHTFSPRDGGSPEQERGSYLWLFRREPDGWRIARVIFNVRDPGENAESHHEA